MRAVRILSVEAGIYSSVSFLLKRMWPSGAAMRMASEGSILFRQARSGEAFRDDGQSEKSTQRTIHFVV